MNTNAIKRPCCFVSLSIALLLFLATGCGSSTKAPEKTGTTDSGSAAPKSDDKAKQADSTTGGSDTVKPPSEATIPNAVPADAKPTMPNSVTPETTPTIPNAVPSAEKGKDTSAIAPLDNLGSVPISELEKSVAKKEPETTKAPTAGIVKANTADMDYSSLLFVFMLATFIGIGVILRVSRLLHTPLMSLTNAISAIAVVGSIIVTGRSESPAPIRLMGAVALFASMTNIVSGFLITDRMLKMFKSPGGGKH